MLGLQIVVVVEHGQGSLYGFVNQIIVLRISHHGNEAECVDNQRNHNEKQTAKQKQAEGLLLWKMSDGIPEKEQGKAGSGVDSRPFGCNV